MLDNIFVCILNMSITASVVILVVLLARLFLKKAGKIFSYALWAVVLFRLLCPFSFESAIGLLPINKAPIPQDIVYQEQPQIDTGISIIDDSINPILPAPPKTAASVNPLQIWLFIGVHIWEIGMLFMLIYSVIQLVRLRKKLIGATPLRDNIYLADHISSPFVMGVIKPKIYLPSSMPDTEQEFIIAHEQYHVKRFDHIARILGFIALTIHWFNPLAWLAFVLSGKDMEMSCDEAVIKRMGTDIRAEYSQSLLRFATDRKLITATPLAFGEGDTKGRVKNVMQYKKPILWVSIIAIIAVVCVVVGFMGNAKGKEQDLSLLNPHMLPSVAHQMESDITVISEDGTEIEISSKKVAAFLDGDFGRKNMDEIKLIPSYQFDVGGTTISLYRSEPSLIKLHNELSQYRYYRKANIYNDFVSLLETQREISDYIPQKLTHDQAVVLALNSLRDGRLSGECFGEGHIILGYDDGDVDKTRIYTLMTTGEYGFENGNFVEVSGSAYPIVVTLFSDNHVEIEQPLDGAGYGDSLEKMFPKEYHDRVFGYDSSDQENMKQQQEKYAKEYLSKIGREAKVGAYADFEYTFLTDVGVSVEVSNNLENFYKQHSYYPSFIGTRERLENGVRVVYEMRYDKNSDEIEFIKYGYDTKETIERFLLNANTGSY